MMCVLMIYSSLDIVHGYADTDKVDLHLVQAVEVHLNSNTMSYILVAENILKTIVHFITHYNCNKSPVYKDKIKLIIFQFQLFRFQAKHITKWNQQYS